MIFDGKTLNGWRGYSKDKAPSRWTVEDGAIKFNGSGGGEAQTGEGGDLIFAKKFKNFEAEMEWKVSKGGMLGHLLPGPGGYDPEGRQDQVRADLHLVPRVSGARQHQPSRCQGVWVSTATASRRRSTT